MLPQLTGVLVGLAFGLLLLSSPRAIAVGAVFVDGSALVLTGREG